MKKIRNALSLLFFIGIWLLWNQVCYAGEQNLNNIHYQANLNADGSMDVIEIWDVYISETNTLFKNFKLNSSQYSGITDVQVKDLDRGIDLTEIYQEMYHVTKDCFYGLKISGNKFEIAWGVGLDNSSATKRYQISYTVQNVVTVYDDCDELYWQFIGTDNGIPAKKVTGTIKLPEPVQNLENLRVWAHGPLNGEIQRESKDVVVFEVNNLSKNTMIEVRVVTQEDIFWQSAKRVSGSKLSSILAEEGKWADEANQSRQNAKIFWGIAKVVYLAIFIFFGLKVMKYAVKLKEVKHEKYKLEKIQYFRDIPRKNEATPAEAAFLYYLDKNTFSSLNARVISATLLQLCLKGYISFDKNEKGEIQINCLRTTNEGLKESENIVFKILKKAALYSRKKVVAIKDINDYASENYDDFERLMENLKVAGREAYRGMRYYNVRKEKEKTSCKTKSIVYFVFIFIILFVSPITILLLPILFEWLFCGIILHRTAKKIQLLTEQGEIEKQQWEALKRYMEDFSLLKEKEEPDLILWEKYLVYATVFGISKKVVEQLKVVYPELDCLESSHYSYLYLISDSQFKDGLIEKLNGGIGKIYNSYRVAYNVAHSSSSSSGSGSGGGFSSGGGGRWWRPDGMGRKINFLVGELL